MEECQNEFKNIKQVLNTPPVLCRLAASDKIRSESNTRALFSFKESQGALIGYHSMRLPHYSITELEFIGLVCNIHIVSQSFKYQYFNVLVDSKAIEI